MIEKDQIHENHQDNDGILEYDNPLPNWFVTLFYGCIIFALLYVGYYTGYGLALAKAGGVGQNLSASGAEYLLTVRHQEKMEGLRKPKEMSEVELGEFLTAPSSISGGESIFKTNCLACHGSEGQGVVGPNLTDEYSLHGGKPAAILSSVSIGYPDKGMPSWKLVLGEEKVRLVSAYVISLRGHQVANPKPPQGSKEP